jgi:hypothetical protein
MEQLIAEWKRQASEVLARFGYKAYWQTPFEIELVTES